MPQFYHFAIITSVMCAFALMLHWQASFTNSTQREMGELFKQIHFPECPSCTCQSCPSCNPCPSCNVEIPPCPSCTCQSLPEDLMYSISSKLSNFDANNSKKCEWEFIEYISSPYEQLWIDHMGEWGEAPCKRYYLDRNNEIADEWYQYTQEHISTPPSGPANPLIFSTQIYRRTCTGEKINIYIEPLALLMRNPKLCAHYGSGSFNNEEFLVDKNYLMVDWEIGRQREDTNGKVFFFDMGASTYNKGSGGASQGWFVENIERRGLELDGIFAWEYTVHDPKEVFKVIPERLWPIYHWFNIPVTDKIGSLANPWEMLSRVATKDDLVVVKLDVDTPVLEVNLIKQVIANDSISDLIDVLYYEDHTNTLEMGNIYGREGLINNYTDSMNLFLGMRRKGIRAHPWV